MATLRIHLKASSITPQADNTTIAAVDLVIGGSGNTAVNTKYRTGGGVPFLEMSDTGSYLEFPSVTLNSGGGGFTVVLVAKQYTGTAQRVVNASGRNYVLTSYRSDGLLCYNDGTVGSATGSLARKLMLHRDNGTVTKAIRDQTDITFGSGVVGTPTRFGLGAIPYSSNLEPANADIYEIRIYDGALNDAEIIALQDSLGAEYVLDYYTPSATLTADAGSFVLSGQTVNFLRNYVLAAATGSFALSGNDAGLTTDSGNTTLTASHGNFDLTGNSVNFLRTLMLLASHGSFALSGQAATFSITVDTTPEITTESTLPWAQVGESYSVQLESIKGEGIKVWDIPTPVTGVSMASDGEVTVASPTGSSIVFTARVRDENGAGESATREFTIPVSVLAVWQFGYDLPLDRSTGKKFRAFIPRSGAADRQTRTDRPKKRRLEIKSSYYSNAEWNAIEDFWDEQCPDKNFLIYDYRRAEYFTAWFPSDVNSKEGREQGDFSLIIEEV